jgi:hypothetical protein
MANLSADESLLPEAARNAENQSEKKHSWLYGVEFKGLLRRCTGLFTFDLLRHVQLSARPQNPREIVAAALPQKSLVVHDVAARYGSIERLVINESGAVFLIETQSHDGTITEENGELRQDGHPLEKDIIRETTTNAFSLREVLENGLGISPRINAAIVFPNASVAVPRAVYGVEIIQVTQLEKWMANARGNPEVARLIMAST